MKKTIKTYYGRRKTKRYPSRLKWPSKTRDRQRRKEEKRLARLWPLLHGRA